jgi:uncharacterized membrane protein YbaN (DUF454 family)
MRNALGALLIIVGIPGLVLPILQGWLFIAVGALLLSVDVPFFDRMVRWLEEKIPQLKKPLERVRNFLKGPGKS